MLQQMNGPKWREKLPKIASFSSFAGLMPTATTATADVASSETSSEKDAEMLFEKHKTEGNKLFAKVIFATCILQLSGQIICIMPL